MYKRQVQTLAVAPSHQRRGLGRGLLDAMLGRAVSAGVRWVHLEVAADNAAAQALYARAGFTTLARRRRYYADGTDALVLRATLASGGEVPQ